MNVAIIQARMGSSRLPGKSMRILGDMPVIWHVIHRVSLSKTIGHFLIATTSSPEDDAIEEFCLSEGIDFFRGPTDDVLSRYSKATEYLNNNGIITDYIVRITGDCPFIDPSVIDKVVHKAMDGNYDYVSNVNPPTYPDGLDVEVFSSSALFEADQKAVLLSDREHVTPFIRNNTYLRKFNVQYCDDYSFLRWTLDEEEDFQFIVQVFNELKKINRDFNMADILAIIDKFPEMSNINIKYHRNEGYLKSLKKDANQ